MTAKPPQILIVEDERIVARDIEEQLVALGYESVGVAMTGQEALALAVAKRPQLVLMDIHLAGSIDGIETAAILRAQYRIPTIFLTAYATDAVVERAKRAQPLGYIIKPFDALILRTNVEIALHKAQMDRELRASEERYRALVESVHDAIVTADRRGDIVGWSPAASRLFGYTEGEALGSQFALLLPEAGRGRQAIAEVSHGAGPSGTVLEIRALRKDGAEFPAELSLSRWETEEGWFVTGMFRDATERHRALEQLRIAATIVTNSPSVLLRWTPDAGWPIDYASANVERLLGYTAEELLERAEPFSAKIHPEDLERVRREVSVFTAGGADRFVQEYRVLTKDGRVRWVEDRTAVERDDDGRVLRFEGVLQDITEKRLAEVSLRLQSAALNAAANAIVITNRDGTIEWVNSAFCRLTGYSAEEAVGRNPRDVVRSGAHDSAFYESLWRVILAGDVWEGEITNRRKDGTLYAEYQTITPVRNTEGSITHFVGIKRDMTEEKRLQEQLVHAQKMEVVGHLAGGIAHDFNNLLTVINGSADLALQELPEHPCRPEIEQILEAGERAAKLTAQLLAFSRKQLLSPVVLDLATEVKNSARMLQRLIGEDVALVMDVAPAAQYVLADRGQIEQVILNLAVNARDAMPGGGRLTIATRHAVVDEALMAEHRDATKGPHAVLSVADTGTGMSADVLERLFEPFFTTKGPGKGTGLGLATVYGIVKQSGGFIVVASERGRGTTFEVYLPSRAADAQSVMPAPAGKAATGAETLLLAEDEQNLRRLATRMLRSAGYNVLEAASGEEALAVIQNHSGPLALLITDVVMTGMSGVDLAARAMAENPGIKVLFTSGYADDRLNKNLLIDSATFIAKPYTARSLANKVRAVLDGGVSETRTSPPL